VFVPLFIEDRLEIKEGIAHYIWYFRYCKLSLIDPPARDIRQQISYRGAVYSSSSFTDHKDLEWTLEKLPSSSTHIALVSMLSTTHRCMPE
jgi:hypothetical protein